MAGDGFEAILAIVGTWKRWQMQLLALGMCVAAQVGYQHDVFVVNSVVTDHWCRIPELEAATPDWTEDQRKEFSIPRHEIDGQMVYSSCEMYIRNYSSFAGLSFNDSMAARLEVNVTIAKGSCSEWHYDRSVYSQSTVMEWDMVCDNKALRPLLQAAYFIGLFSATFVFAPLADRLGRKTVTLTALALSIASTYVSTIAPNFSFLLGLRFLAGMGAIASYANCYIIVLEISEASRRPFITFLYDLGTAVGALYLGIMGYFVRDWQMTFFVGAISFTPVLILCIWLLPESPRWLIINGHIEKAMSILEKAAVTNHQPIEDSNILSSTVKEFHRQEMEYKENDSTAGMSGARKALWSLHSLVRGPELRRRSLCMYFCWFAIAWGSFGSTYLAARLPLGVFYLIMISSIQAIILRLVLLKPVNILPRRSIFVPGFFLLALFLLTSTILPADWTWINFSVLILGKLCTNANFTYIYLYTSELFPTEIRSMSLSIGSFCARIAAISAPFIVDLLVHYHRSIPAALFGVVALLAGILSLLLPETQNQSLPETVAEVELGRISRMRRGDRELHETKNDEKIALDKTSKARNTTLH